MKKRLKPHISLAEEKTSQYALLAVPKARRLAPRVINVDKNAAYSKAITKLKVNGVLLASVELRQVKYLNNLIEQDHHFIKRLTKPGVGFFSDLKAWRTLLGFEIMNMIRKGQVQGVGKGDVRSQIALVAKLFKTRGGNPRLLRVCLYARMFVRLLSKVDKSSNSI